MTMITTADAAATRETGTPSRPPTPGGSQNDPTDLITVKTCNHADARKSVSRGARQAQFDELLAGVYERLRRERSPLTRTDP